MSPADYLAKAERALASARLLLADYTGEAIDQDRATWAVDQAAAFVQAITQHIDAVPPIPPGDMGGSS